MKGEKSKVQNAEFLKLKKTSQKTLLGEKMKKKSKPPKSSKNPQKNNMFAFPEEKEDTFIHQCASQTCDVTKKFWVKHIWYIWYTILLAVIHV